MLGYQSYNRIAKRKVPDAGKIFCANMGSILSSQTVVPARTEHTAYDILRQMICPQFCRPYPILTRLTATSSNLRLEARSGLV